MEMWMKGLTCAGYEYMKLMVAELQRQLDEIEETKGECHSVVGVFSFSKFTIYRPFRWVID